VAGLAFFAVNCWVLGVMVGDIGNREEAKQEGLKGGKGRRDDHRAPS